MSKLRLGMVGGGQGCDFLRGGVYFREYDNFSTFYRFNRLWSNL